MRDRLPVNIENFELPRDDFVYKTVRSNSYGYVSFLYLLSVLITLGSVLVVIFFGNR